MNRYGIAAITLAAALGCGGLMGYGQEVGSAPVTSGAPFTVTYTPSSNLEHQLWLDYDLALAGGWSVTGTVDATANGASVGTWQLDFDGDGPPVVGATGEFTLNAVQTVVNGNGSARGTVWLAKIPGQPSGTPVTVTGTFTSGTGTTINAMRLVVTD